MNAEIKARHLQGLLAAATRELSAKSEEIKVLQSQIKNQQEPVSSTEEFEIKIKQLEVQLEYYKLSSHEMETRLLNLDSKIPPVMLPPSSNHLDAGSIIKIPPVVLPSSNEVIALKLERDRLEEELILRYTQLRENEEMYSRNLKDKDIEIEALKKMVNYN